MKPPGRSHVSSSFTLIKGAMIDETYAVFAAWDFASSKLDFGQKFNGLAMVRKAKYGACQFL